MPELVEEKTVFTLSEVSNSIEKTLKARYASAYWIKAEMNKLNHYSHSGHCFPELVEKEGDKVVAQMRSHMWRNEFLAINHQFLKVLREPLKDGIKILFLAKITYTAMYGLSLHILDIDPSYTLGDLEREKQDSIRRLREEGIYNANKQIPIPLLPQRIAIISVETSKGYADFLQVIDNNDWGYSFFHMLFPSLLQGDAAVTSIVKQLNRIRKVLHHFDVVAIIRGGGGDIGLSCYNHYDLARAIATFPLPVITGIGHATNETVAEMISHTNAITPTKIGQELLQKFHDFSVPVNDAREEILYQGRQIIEDEKLAFRHLAERFRTQSRWSVQQAVSGIRELSGKLLVQTRLHVREEHSKLELKKQTVRQGVKYFIRSQLEIVGGTKTHLKEILPGLLNYENQEVDKLEHHVKLMHPENVLKRGYSITRLHGKSVRSSDEVKKGDELEIEVYRGKIWAKAVKNEKNEKN
ncbi:MAG: exodeoxyribonuclease VII large subunit [Bacteroidetes bacterium]|nr:exodeoxyribonuclease VII large subunit [Bacteroidota bacterium]